MDGSAEFPPYPTAFFEKIKPLIHDGIIEYMADLDAGDLNAGPQAAAIRTVLQTERATSPLGFEPGESFCLAALIDPSDQTGPQDSPNAHDMHLARLLGSGCMLVDYPTAVRALLTPIDTIPILVESTIAVEPGWLGDLTELFDWFIRVCETDGNGFESDWFWNGTLSRIALVMIASAQGSSQRAGSIVAAVHNILMRRDSIGNGHRAAVRIAVDPEIFGRSEKLWRRLAHATLSDPPEDWSKADRDAAAMLAHKVIYCGLTHRLGIDI